MAEPKILGTYPSCQLCGSKETISQLGTADLKAKGKILPATLTQTKAEVIPLEQPMLAAITVACIILHYDICAGCGFERVTQAEVAQAPIQMQMQGQRPGGNGQIPRGFGHG